MNLSNQAVACVMMALQKALLEQTDIVPILYGFNFLETPEGLTILNPPESIDSDALQSMADGLDAERN